MRRRISAAMLAPCLLFAVACSPAAAPDANMTGTNSANAFDDELLDTSPDSLAAPDDAGNLAEPANAAR